MRLRSLLSAIAVLACTTAGLVTVAPPATAAATCAGVSKFGTGKGVHLRPTTTNGSGSINCVLGSGSRGKGVEELQKTLKQCYGQAVAVDGVFGTQTRSAVVNAQAFHGLPRDGVFGPNTSKSMFWRLYNSPGRCTFDL